MSVFAPPDMHELTAVWTVGDGVHFPPKLLLLDLLEELPRVGHEALDASVLPVGHAQLLAVREVGQAVRNAEWGAFPPIR